jgi:hypothetical protein
MVNENRYRWKHCLVIAALALGLAIAGVGLAQTTGTVEGTVVDQSGGVLPGVTVELAGPSLQGTRSAVTGADGRYRFPSVPPGTYAVTGTLTGFGKVQKRAVVTLDATTKANLDMNLSASAEVTVTGEAPLVDTTSTTTGSNYNAKIIDKLPVSRNYTDVVFSQPGVQADFGENQGRSPTRIGGISVYGSTSSENQYLIDGVNTTNVIKGFQGKDLNNEFVQEVEVKTGGYQAEYGRNTGGVINVITKSGGNEFHGGAFGYYNDTGMRATPESSKDGVFNTPDFSQTGASQHYYNRVANPNYFFEKDVRQEWGMDLGGYFWKDKIWFFGAYDRVQANQNWEMLDPAAPTYQHLFPNSYTQNKYSGKLTINATQSTSIVGSVFSDHQTQEGNISVSPPLSNVPATYSGRRDTGGPDYGARLNQLFGSVGIFTFQYAQHSDRYHTIPTGPENISLLDYTASPDGSSSIVYNGFGNVFGPTLNNQSKRNLYNGSFTFYLGNHEVKLGGDFSDEATEGVTYYTGTWQDRARPCLQTGSSICDLSQAPFYTNPQGDTRQVFWEHDYYVSGTPSNNSWIADSPFNTPIKRYSGFIQDQWRIMPTLTVNAGVRYDSENYYGLDPITGPFKAFSLTDSWSPRVGFVWDWAGDGSSKLYGSWGYFYYAVPTDLTVRVFTTNAAVFATNYNQSIPGDTTSIVQLNLPTCTSTLTTGCVPRQQLFQGGDAHTEPVDPGTKAPYQQEFTIGVEKALDPTLSVGLKGTYRALMRTVEDRCDLNADLGPDCPNCAANSCALTNPGTNLPSANGYYPTCNGTANETDPTFGQCTTEINTGAAMGKASRYFRGIELTARKSFSNNLWAQLSFLYSSLKGNYSGAIREASGQTDPGINADYDYYNFSYNAYGNLELDRPAQGRLDMVYTAPFGLSAGLGFYVRSGIPVSQLGYFNEFYPDLLYLDTRGTLYRTPTDYDLNLSASYNFNVGPVTITPMVYLFNVIDRQTPVAYLTAYNVNGSFVTNPSSPFYGEAGVEPGTGSCPATASAPCTDNPDYNKVLQYNTPRLLRVALKITF